MRLGGRSNSTQIFLQKLIYDAISISSYAKRDLMIDEFAEPLSRFGITFNQAKIYLATLSLGEASIESISKLAKVRREDVYRTLPKLCQVGIVHRLLGTPLRVRAIPLREATRILIQEKQAAMGLELYELATLAEELAHNHKEKFLDSIDDNDGPQFEMIEGKVAVRMKSLELARSFQSSMSLVLDEQQLNYLAEALRSESQSADQARLIRIIARTPSQSKISMIKEWQSSVEKPIEIKYVDNVDTSFGIYDERVGILQVPGENNERCSLLSKNCQFVSLLNQNFNSLWDNGKEGR
jgi:sugar-specific transcriptional regulator TrmB